MKRIFSTFSILLCTQAGAFAQTNLPPLPRIKPIFKAQPAPQPQSKSEKTQGIPDKKVFAAIPQTSNEANCRVRLKKAGALFSTTEPVTAEQAGCGIPAPVKISAISIGKLKLKLPGAPVLNCKFALRFTHWAKDVAAPIVAGTTGKYLTSIVTGPGYQCRRRNRAKSGKVSEHALGNAIDISYFLVGKKTRLQTAQRATGSPAQKRLLQALSTSACGYFTTVLGPGSNAAHATHFHFDYQKRGKGWNYRICE